MSSIVDGHRTPSWLQIVFFFGLCLGIGGCGASPGCGCGKGGASPQTKASITSSEGQKPWDTLEDNQPPPSPGQGANNPHHMDWPTHGAPYAHPLLCPSTSLPSNSPTPCLTWQHIIDFAPYVHLHPQDRFRPIAMEQLLAHVEHVTHAGIDTAPREPESEPHAPLDLIHPMFNITPPYLPDTLAFNPNIRLHLDARFEQDYTPEPIGQVPFYVSLQQIDPESIDITYWFVFAYNGPQMALFSWADQTQLFQLPTFAEHQGDVESITLRLAWPDMEVISLRTEQHGMSRYHPPQEVMWSGHHPHIDIALHSHATYPSREQGGNQHHLLLQKTIGKLTLQFVDVTDSQGELWHHQEQLAQPGHVVLIGIDDDGQSLTPSDWVRFAGYLGRQQNNRFTQIVTLEGESLTTLLETAVHLVAKSVEFLGFLNPYLQASGPFGFAMRGRVWLHPSQAPFPLLQEPQTFLGGGEPNEDKHNLATLSNGDAWPSSLAPQGESQMLKGNITDLQSPPTDLQAPQDNPTKAPTTLPQNPPQNPQEFHLPPTTQQDSSPAP